MLDPNKTMNSLIKERKRPVREVENREKKEYTIW